jgi:anti-sigma regulatory factor (Ser/Thr protein kinase)
VSIPALPEQVRVARTFVAGVLGPSHGHADVAVLLASELVTNSVRHSGSAVPGGLITVTVTARGDDVRVEVTDCGAGGVPVLLPACSGRILGRWFDLGLRHRNDRHSCVSRWRTGCW